MKNTIKEMVQFTVVVVLVLVASWVLFAPKAFIASPIQPTQVSGIEITDSEPNAMEDMLNNLAASERAEGTFVFGR